MQKEALNKSFIAWKYNTTVYHQPFVIESFFSKINSEIKKYFSPRIVEEIHKQMCESILYRYERIDIDDAFAFDDQSVKILLELGVFTRVRIKIRCELEFYFLF